MRSGSGLPLAYSLSPPFTPRTVNVRLSRPSPPRGTRLPTAGSRSFVTWSFTSAANLWNGTTSSPRSAPRVHQRVVERVQLVHLVDRIVEGGDVWTTLPSPRLAAAASSAAARRTVRAAFLAGAQPAIPEIDSAWKRDCSISNLKRSPVPVNVAAVVTA